MPPVSGSSCGPSIILVVVALANSVAQGIDLQNAKHITAIDGDNVVLDCPLEFPSGQSVPYVIEWKKQKMKSPLYIWYDGYQPHVADPYRDRVSRVDLRSRRHGLASLNMTHVRESDAGWYECVVHFLNRSPAVLGNGTWVHLDVHAPPRLVSKSPKDVFVNIGDSVILSCEARGTPEPIISWYKEDIPVQTSDRISIRNEGSELRISRLSRENIGDYTCFAENREGNVHWTSKVIMAGGAVIVAGPNDVTAIETNRAVLNCRASSLPSNFTVSWLRDNVPLEQLSGLRRRHRVTGNGTLVIEPVSAEDAGTFTCHVSNGIGTAQRASAQLSVEYAAHVPYTPSVQYLPLGMPGVIRCHIKANPAIQFVNWYRNRREYDPANIPGVTLLLNGSLLIENVSLEHQGTYVCRPFNLHGSKGDSADMQVVVRQPPRFVLLPPPLYQRSVYDSVEMACRAEGAPQPQVTWRRHDNQSLPAERVKVEGGNITISSIRKSDFGFYECVARNSVSTIATSTQLVVEGTTPHAPHNITTNATNYAISVQWQPGYSGGADFQQRYVVWYQQTDVGQWNTYEVTPVASTSVTIYHLLPNTTYELMVAAKNSIGDGMFSEKLVVTTPAVDTESPVSLQNAQEVDGTGLLPVDSRGRIFYPMVFVPRGPRPGAPREVTIKPTPDGHHLLTWRPPSGHDAASPVLYYSIKYKAAGENWRRMGDEKLQTTKYLVKRLVRGKRYLFKVFAHSLTSYSDSHEVALNVPSVPQRKAITAALVGGLLLLIVSVILSVCTVKICNKHKRRKQEKEYNMVACRVNEARNGLHSPAALKKRGVAPGLQALYATVNKSNPQSSHPVSPGYRSRLVRYWLRLTKGHASAYNLGDDTFDARGGTQRDRGPDNSVVFQISNTIQEQQQQQQQQNRWSQRKSKGLEYRVHMEFQSQPLREISRQSDGRFVLSDRQLNVDSIDRPALLDKTVGDTEGGFTDTALRLPAAVRGGVRAVDVVGPQSGTSRTVSVRDVDVTDECSEDRANRASSSNLGESGLRNDACRRVSDGFGRHQLPSQPSTRSVMTPDGYRFRASSPGAVAGELGPFDLCELSSVPVQQLSTITLPPPPVTCEGNVTPIDGAAATVPSSSAQVFCTKYPPHLHPYNPQQIQQHQLYENWPPLGRWRGPLAPIGASLAPAVDTHAPWLLRCLQLQPAGVSTGVAFTPFYANLHADQRGSYNPVQSTILGRRCQSGLVIATTSSVTTTAHLPLATSSPPPPPIPPPLVPLVYRAEPQASSGTSVRRVSTVATGVLGDSGDGLSAGVDEVSPSSSLGRQPLAYTRERLQMAIGRVRGDSQLLATPPPLLYLYRSHLQQQQERQKVQRQVDGDETLTHGDKSYSQSSSGITSKNSSATASSCQQLAPDSADPPTSFPPQQQQRQQQQNLDVSVDSHYEFDAELVSAVGEGYSPKAINSAASVTQEATAVQIVSNTSLHRSPTEGTTDCHASDMEARVMAMRKEFHIYRQRRNTPRVVMETVC